MLFSHIKQNVRKVVWFRFFVLKLVISPKHCNNETHLYFEIYVATNQKITLGGKCSALNITANSAFL